MSHARGPGSFQGVVGFVREGCSRQGQGHLLRLGAEGSSVKDVLLGVYNPLFWYLEIEEGSKIEAYSMARYVYPV